MRILFLTPRLPLPADTGAKIRTFNLLKNVAKENQATLLSFYFGENDQPLEDLKILGIKAHLVKAKDKISPSKIFGQLPLSIEKYSSKEMKNKLRELLAKEKIDLVHFDHLHMGQYRQSINGVPCVLDEHNIEAIILERLASIEKSFAKRLLFKSQAKKMSTYESGLAREFSRCLTVSDRDKEKLSELSGNSMNIEVVPNGVDTEYFSSSTHKLANLSEEDALVFTGSMDWLPNSDAVEYFCKEILPLIWKERQSVKFYIVGKNPSNSIIKLGNNDSRIIVTGLVRDVRPYIANSKIFVAPLRVGGGTRLKILEAMAMSKPVVSTTIGAEGIAYTQDKNIILKDSPEEFAQAALELLKNESMRDLLGKYGRELVCSTYDWQIISRRLSNIYRTIAG